MASTASNSNGDCRVGCGVVDDSGMVADGVVDQHQGEEDQKADVVLERQTTTAIVSQGDTCAATVASFAVAHAAHVDASDRISDTESSSDEKARERMWRSNADDVGGSVAKPGAWPMHGPDPCLPATSMSTDDRTTTTEANSSSSSSTSRADPDDYIVLRQAQELEKVQSRRRHDLEEIERGLAHADDYEDIKYEEYGGPNERGIARATSIDESDDDLPAAIEFDPETDTSRRSRHLRNSHNVEYYSGLAACTVLVVVVVWAVVAAWQRRPSDTVMPSAFDDRAVLGIREYVAQQLVSTGAIDTSSSSRSSATADELLNDLSNPYRKALDWIQNVDALALSPHNGTKFMQRFLCAYFFFSTSVEHPWTNGCEPISTFFATTNSVGNGDDNNCLYHFKLAMPGLDVYTRTNGATRWLGSSDERHWGGVECDSVGNVVALEFSGSNMTGSFPEGISGFPFLQYLTLSLGQLSGTLPTTLGVMKHLIGVNLAGNRFTGPIPDSWYQSRSLQRVDVSANEVTGTISAEIGNWKDVKALSLSENELIGSIPNTIGDLRGLEFLSLSSNQLIGTIPTSIGNLRHALFVALDRNRLVGAIPAELGRVTLCRYLYLQFNHLNATLPTEMSMLSDLRELDLSHNHLTGSIAPVVKMTKVESVRIDNNQFSGTLPQGLGRLKQMTQFIASGNAFNGTVSRKICNLVAPKNQPNPAKLLLELQLDCSVTPPGTTAEISCPEGCCTQCCEVDGTNCKDMIID